MVRSIILVLVFGWCFASTLAKLPVTVKTLGNYKSEKNPVNYRLPNNTKPEAYNVSLSTDIHKGNFNFYGEVNIIIVVLEKTNNITVHQRDLVIESARLTTEDGHDVALLDSQYDKRTEFLTFVTKSETLSAGSRLSLTIKYKGILTEGTYGFHRRPSVFGNEYSGWIASTTFEPNATRRAFPCYDEPALKATFDISIAHGSLYVAISNMPVAEEKKNEDRTITRFQRTQPMSTYSVTFAVANYAFIEKTVDGIKFLMDNWGLIISQSVNDLMDGNMGGKQVPVSTTVAHAISHQWFGGLVTPKWWNHLWLNEGLATLFRYEATDWIHPEWNVTADFLSNEYRRALASDATVNLSRPMTFYTDSPSGVNELYDTFAYSKPASVLRMFMHAFTKESFRKGLKYYLKQRSLQEATDLDLFNGLEIAVKEDKTLNTDLNVKDILSSWTDQIGFPVLIVTRNYEDNSLVISQERYLHKYPHPASNQTSWWIPYNFYSANNIEFNNTSAEGWLPKGTRSVRVKSNSAKNWTSNDWVLFNKQQTSFYRVFYDKKNYQLLQHELINGDVDKIPVVNRIQYVDDTSSFVTSGRLPHDTFLNLLNYLKRETELGPWKAVQDALSNIKSNLVEGSQLALKYQKHVASILKPIYEEGSLTNAMNGRNKAASVHKIVTQLACDFGVESCMKSTKLM